MSYPHREILVETFSFDPTRLEEGGTFVEKLGGGRYRFKAKSQHCGVKNRNNRVYPVQVWEQHTTPEAAFSKRVASRRVIGHLEHPSDGKSQMGMAAVLVIEVAAPDKNGEVWAIFETLSTPAGMIVASFIRDGVGFGISSRGNGSVVNKGGIDEVQEDYEPITFDMVIDESTPGAEVHARRLKESLCALMESAGGDQVRAIRMDQELAEVAMARDFLTEQMPPTGFSKFCMAFNDGSAHYRAYDNGVGQWDVWLHPHNLPPEEIVTGLSTTEAAQEAAKQHYRMVELSGQRDAEGEAQQALKREWGRAEKAPPVLVPPGWAAVREAFSVRGAMPYSGLAVKLAFTSAAEAKTAYSVIERAGFHVDLEDEYVTVYTSIEDESAAVSHLTRLLSSKGIDTQAESVGFIRRGQAVREDAMTLRRLDEMPYGGMEEMPYDMGTDDEDPMYDAEDEPDDDSEDDDSEDDEEPAEMCGRRHELAYEQDDEEDDEPEDEPEYEALPGVHYGRGRREAAFEQDDEEDDEYGDDPEDLDVDIDVDESEEDDMYEEYEDDDGYVKVWFDENDEPVEYHHYTEDGILEAVVDSDGDLLVEMPSAGMRAMFAKAFASTPRSKKTGKPKDPESTAAAVRAKPGGAEYYRKFRGKWAGLPKGGKGKVNAKVAAKDGVRLAKGKGLEARKKLAVARRGKRTGMKHAPAEKVRKDPRVKKALKARGLAASVERFFDPETNLIETYMGDTLIEARDHDTGLVLFELRGGKGSPAAAMFAKTFSKKPPATKIRKEQPNYKKIRQGYAGTDAGKGMDPAKLVKGSRALPKREKKARAAARKKAAPVKKAMRTLRKGAAKVTQGSFKPKSIAKKGTTKRGRAKGMKAGGSKKKAALKALAASFEYDVNDLLIEDTTGVLYHMDGTVVGGIDEDGDPFFYDEDGDQVWLDEDEYEDEYDYIDEMEVGAHGGGTPVALKMKGAEARYTVGTFGSHGGGDAKSVKRKSGSPNTMRGGGGGEDQEESYSPYVARLEDQVARQQEVIDAYQDLQYAEAMQEAKTSILDAHPELSVVEARLDRCQSAEDMRVEAEALLTLVESSRGNRSWTGKVDGNGVSSASVGGAPDVSLLTEEQVITGFDAALSGAEVSDTASRVAAARRRRLDETQN